MIKNIFKIVIVFLIGTVGGIFAEQIFWPYFVERPLFYQYKLETAPVYITERKEMVVQENTALQETIGKVEKTVVGVKTKTNDGAMLFGSGLAVTTDGLIITAAEIVPQGSIFAFYIDGDWPLYQILKRDLANNLALIKVDNGKLNTAGFADFAKLKLGQRVFLVSMDFQATTTPALAVDEGIITSFNEKSIKTNILAAEDLLGTPLFDIEGNLVGLVDSINNSRVSVVPITLIRQFIGF